jgi:hypothetical protein
VADVNKVSKVLPVLGGVGFPTNGARSMDVSFKVNAASANPIPDVRVTFFEVNGSSSNTTANYGPVALGGEKYIHLTDIASPYVQLSFEGLAGNVTIDYLNLSAR